MPHKTASALLSRRHFRPQKSPRDAVQQDVDKVSRLTNVEKAYKQGNFAGNKICRQGVFADLRSSKRSPSATCKPLALQPCDWVLRSYIAIKSIIRSENCRRFLLIGAILAVVGFVSALNRPAMRSNRMLAKPADRQSVEKACKQGNFAIGDLQAVGLAALRLGMNTL